MTQAPLHRSETNGVAEMAVHRMREGTAVALAQSGHNFYDKISDNKTRHQKRYGKEFDGPLIPFGTLVGCVPITAKDKSRKDPPVWKENAQRMIVGLCTTYGKNKVGQTTHWFSYFEGLQETEATTKTPSHFALNVGLVSFLTLGDSSPFHNLVPGSEVSSSHHLINVKFHSSLQL